MNDRAVKLPRDANGERLAIGDTIRHLNGDEALVIGIDAREDVTRIVLKANGMAYIWRPEEVTRVE